MTQIKKGMEAGVIFLKKKKKRTLCDRKISSVLGIINWKITNYELPS